MLIPRNVYSFSFITLLLIIVMLKITGNKNALFIAGCYIFPADEGLCIGTADILSA